MATRQIFIDDIDGTENDVETITFALDGTAYEVDLGKENQERLRAFLDEFVAASRVLGRDGRPRPTRRTPARVTRKMAAAAEIAAQNADVPAPADLPKFDSKLARAWLRENKFPVPDRGRIRGDVALPYLQSEDFQAWQAAQG